MSTFSVLLTALAFLSGAHSMEWQPRSSYDPTEEKVLGRHHPIVFANETHGFLLGGSTRFSDADNAFYIYNEATDQWENRTEDALDFPPRSFGYGVVLNQANHPKAYLGFGAGPNGERLNDWWEMDMTTLEFRQLASCPGVGRRHPSMVPVYLADDQKWQIHVGLGDSYIGEPAEFANLDDYWSYDIETNQWTQLPDFPSSKRHHPFYFGIEGISYTGLGHSSGYDPYIERDFYSYSTATGEWTRELDLESYSMEDGSLQTTEARVAGTEFSIEFPIVGADSSEIRLVGALGFVLSGDGDDHGTMAEGEFHAFYPANSPLLTDPNKRWRQLPPHPGVSRWAPASFVIRGTARVYFTSGYDRANQLLPSDLWTIDLSSLFALADTPSTVLSAQEEPDATSDGSTDANADEEQAAGAEDGNSSGGSQNGVFDSGACSKHSAVVTAVLVAGISALCHFLH